MPKGRSADRPHDRQRDRDEARKRGEAEDEGLSQKGAQDVCGSATHLSKEARCARLLQTRSAAQPQH